MGLFGKSFAEKVQDAVAAVNGKNLGVKNLRAVVDGKVVTLEGEAPNLDVKGRVVREFNALVDTENTINKIRIPAPEPTAGVKPPMPVSSPVEAEQVHVVVAGDTLSALAKKYYGKAGMYMKIFEANRDILNNPDLIKVGQKLRIPK
ncbi:MAG: LysM peptidoglycan-binding domain-containing protein [Candidatus Aminicenantes bacterium]|nr:LysM peptidoglycan-binding domain-containing protein [Candidatus Aminicenantes bacterium]